ncbi:MAG: hypothetical protein LCH81_12010 [Bacteroidetes bacterium]|nr:hypothetical protein [Bacteroidota bacterium]
MEAKISILTFPQRIENERLYFNVLVIPRNFNPLLDDPIQALSPAWVNATLQLRAYVSDSLADYPMLNPAPAFNVLLPDMPTDPDATEIFNTLALRFDISSTATAEAPKATHFARKYLPLSYRDAFHFTRPRTDRAAIDDSYACALDKEKEPAGDFKPDNDQVSWGQVFAFCLRQPAIARKCGFIREAFVDLTPGFLANGGWLFVDFEAGSSYDFADMTAVKRYAARLPKIQAGENRPLFAAVQFRVRLDDMTPPPLNPEMPSAYDELLVESSMYDDGFAKIVHAQQPVSDHMLKETHDPEFPVTNDSGIRLAWDDEQLLIWMNRQMEENPKKPGTQERDDAPMGVFGYRIDVRERSADDANPNAWTSLCEVRNKTDLAIGAALIDSVNQQRELNVEVYPSIPDGRKNKHFWLPAYFAYWTGKSLVLQDEDAIDLFRKDQNTQQDGTPQAAVKNLMYDPVGLENVPLLYGRQYQFRTRFADMTGGGPAASQEPVYAAEAPVATHHFKRHAIPQTVRLQHVLPETDGAYFTENQLVVQRPLLGYPSVLFTGAYPNALDLLKADFDLALGSRDIGIADPDVDRLEIEVAVRALDMDTTVLKHQPQDHFAILYTTTRAFPADLNGDLNIPLVFVDRPVLNFSNSSDLQALGLSDNTLSINDLQELVLPTHRDIQITVRAKCSEKEGYYAHGNSITGMPSRIVTRRAATSETAFFKPTGAPTMIRGIYLRRTEEPKVKAKIKHVFIGSKATPEQSPTLIQRLATAIDVQNKGMSLMGKNGQRWQFGAARAIRHTLAPDNTSITIATEDDLINHWLVPITLLIDRDWSWDGIKPDSIDIFRRKKFALADDWEDEIKVGDVELKKGINIQALSNADRSQTFLCFLDAVEPKSTDPTLFPDEIMVEYRIEPRFKEENPELTVDAPLSLSLLLPITTPPAQMPNIVSAGMAMSRYQRDPSYANTEARQRYLWVEFEKPLDNPRDAYFGRITAYAPDPLLAEWTEDWMKPRQEPPLAIEPEPIRIISPGHSDNQSGLNAMQQLIPATGSKRHFLVPLPPGLHPESPELFGFFTYEFRVGHRDGWSTAQGRFGRALSYQGVQHPYPQLIASPDRNETRIRVSAPHAQSVFDGREVTGKPVRTQMWALLYAQVRMADDSDNRNVLLDDRFMRPMPRFDVAGALLLAQDDDAPQRSLAEWSNAEISALLKNYGLPADSPLSVLCVEMMPGSEHFVMRREYVESYQHLARTIDEPGRALDFIRNTGAILQISQAMAQAPPEELLARPLSDDLGSYRMLRTSTLTAVPEVCCVDC